VTSALRFAFPLVFAFIPLRALAQQPAAKEPAPVVKTSATVEVLEDPAQVDEVISRMKSSPKVDTAPARATTTPSGTSTDSDDLRNTRPDQPDDQLDRDRRNAILRAERRRLMNERTQHLHSPKSP
jgi:hypothetical protein